MSNLTLDETKELFNSIRIAKEECKDNYALAYLNAINESGTLYGNNGIKTQLLYCLNNMQYWKGEKAREVKKVFKKVIKKLG